jgi:uncharacterized membrane protein (UPF0127 family)
MDKQKIPLVIGVLVFLLILMLAFLGGKENHSSEACFGEKCFSIELALTSGEREVGLMNRAQMDADKGMLFVFENEGVYPFWMKNTLIPLDMIWIDSDYHVVYIERNALPCTSDPCPVFNPGKKAKYVLEINGGLTDKTGIKEGDLVAIKEV